MKIRTWLVLGFISVAMVASAVAGLSAVFIEDAHDQFKTYSQTSVDDVRAASDMRNHAYQLYLHTYHYLLTGNTAHIGKIDELEAHIQRKQERYRDRGGVATDKIIAANEEVIATTRSLRSTIEPESTRTANLSFPTGEEPGLDQYDSTVIPAITAESNAMLALIESRFALTDSTILAMIYLSLLTSILFGLFFARSISSPLEDITTTIRALSRGDLSISISAEHKDRNDELGSLARSFDRVMASLKLAMKQSAPHLQQEIESQSAALEQHQEKLESAISMLDTVIDSIDEGILMVDTQGHVLLYNEQFLKMWKIPADIAENATDAELIEHIKEQLTDPDSFIERVEYLYEHPEEKATTIVRFKDGRVYERRSGPHMLDGEITGRIWRYSDITEEYNAE